MSETTTAPAAQPGAVPTPTVHEPATTTEPINPAAPTPGPTPVVPTTAAIAPEPTAAPEVPVSLPPATTTAAPMAETMPEPQPAQSVPEPTAVAAKPTPATVTEPKADADFVEPQNTLTKKFTEAEWKALKEFRAQLADIPAAVSEGSVDSPKATNTPITLWGITLDPAKAQKDARVSVVLMKFLRARNLSVTDARTMLINTLRWREEFNIEAALKEEFPQDVFGNLGHVYGKDKGGRPVVYNIYGGNQDLKAVFGDVQRFIRWRVALMERSVELLDFNEIDQTLQVHDYEGVSLTSRDANSKAAASEATNIFQSHYPELLYKKFFVNVPTLLNWIFWAFKPILPAATLAKMTVVGSGHAITKALLPYISKEELPEKYGGEAKAF